MVLGDPVFRRRQQEGLDLGLCIVKHPGAPAVVLPLIGVAVFIAGAAVKFIQAELILAEMGGHPVQQHADARLVALVDKIHEVLGRPVTGSGSEIARTLIAPGGVQRMLRHRQQLDEIVAHVLHIGHQLLRQIPVAHGFAVFIALPGAQMDLVGVERGLADLLLVAQLAEGLVVPFIAADIIQLGSGARPGLRVKGIGVRLQAALPVRPGDGEFIKVVFLQPRHKALPDLVLHKFHGMGRGVPAVEFPHDGNSPRVRRPGAEHVALRTAARFGVGAEKLIAARLRSLVENMAVECQRVFFSHGFSLLVLCESTDVLPAEGFARFRGFSVFLSQTL